VPIGRVAVNMTAGAVRFPTRPVHPHRGGAAVIWASYANRARPARRAQHREPPARRGWAAVSCSVVGLGFVLDAACRPSTAGSRPVASAGRAPATRIAAPWSARPRRRRWSTRSEGEAPPTIPPATRTIACAPHPPQPVVRSLGRGPGWRGPVGAICAAGSGRWIRSQIAESRCGPPPRPRGNRTAGKWTARPGRRCPFRVRKRCIVHHA
jgi:hypothetical protein